MKAIIINGDIYKVVKSESDNTCSQCDLYNYCKNFDNELIPGCLAHILESVDSSPEQSLRFEKIS